MINFSWPQTTKIATTSVVCNQAMFCRCCCWIIQYAIWDCHLWSLVGIPHRLDGRYTATHPPSVHQARSGSKLCTIPCDRSLAELCQFDALPALLPLAACATMDPLKPVTCGAATNLQRSKRFKKAIAIACYNRYVDLKTAGF